MRADDLLFVTGGDRGFFLPILTLLGSWTAWAPAGQLKVCDFGFSASQRQFLERLGCLLPRPLGFAPDAHPWLLKSAIGRFSEPYKRRGLAWIDADCMVEGPLADDLASMLGGQSAQPTLVACADPIAGTIDAFVRNMARHESYDISPYLEAVDKQGIARSMPYLNSAVFATNDFAFLEAWERAAVRVKQHTLFEQNMFNVVCRSKQGPEIVLVDAQRYNVMDAGLDDCRVDIDAATLRPCVTAGETNVVVVHTTAAGTRIERLELEVDVAGRPMRGPYRLCTNSHLAELQQLHLQAFCFEHRDLLEACGLLVSNG